MYLKGTRLHLAGRHGSALMRMPRVRTLYAPQRCVPARQRQRD